MRACGCRGGEQLGGSELLSVVKCPPCWDKACVPPGSCLCFLLGVKWLQHEARSWLGVLGGGLWPLSQRPGGVGVELLCLGVLGSSTGAGWV